MTIGSLFSGIGGMELGLERAGLGPVMWQVECKPECRRVLAKHWPNVARYKDVRTVGRTTLTAVDLICGGFPCQDISSAGKRAGLSGARSGLWHEFLRIVAELGPRWVVVENVASGAPAWIEAVCHGLEQRGFAVLPIPLAAADLGAPHERKRVFIVATNVDREQEPTQPIHAAVAGAPALANVDGARLSRRCIGGIACAPEPMLAGDHWRTSQPNVVRMVHGVPKRLDRPSKRVSALGNAVVPQCAEVIGYVIRELRGDPP